MERLTNQDWAFDHEKVSRLRRVIGAFQCRTEAIGVVDRAYVALFRII